MLHTKIYLLPVSMLAITIASGIITSSSHTLAEDISPVDDTINITVDSACTMGQTTISTNPTINPGETGTIGTSRIAAYCNDANGYDIYAIGYTNGEYGNTDIISTNGNIIPTGTSGEGSYWNVRLTPGTATGQTTHIPTIVSPFNNDTNIPSDYTKVVTYPSTTIPQGTDPTVSGSYFKAFYDAHASTTQPAGTYTGQIQYVMVHPVGAPKPVIPYTMQNTEPIKRKLTNVGDSLQAADTRDGKKYWITKEADGNIWMTQNLDLDLDSTKVYTPNDTDITENWTPVRNTIHFPGAAGPGNAWTIDKTRPTSADPGELFIYPTNDTYVEDRYASLADCLAEHPDCSWHNHVGNYYNWSAAVANNNTSRMYAAYSNAAGSICPAGWRLPTGRDGDNTAASREYNALLVAEGIMTNPVGNGYATNGSDNIRISPLWLVRSGGIYHDTHYEVGHSGYYWTSTIESGSYAYSLYMYNSDKIYPAEDSERSLGYSVRCIAR